MQATRYILAHAVDFIHAYLLRHWPYWTCRWVMALWPDDESHDCWFCRWCNWNQPEED